MSFLSVQDVCFSYKTGGRTLPILDHVSLDIQRGEFVAILGRSGSGKSTLFHLIGCLSRPDSGKIFLDGMDLTTLPGDSLALVRNRKIGFVFQQFHLLPRGTVLENILLPTLYPAECAANTPEAVERAKALARELGIESLLDKAPNQLSGGEQQRVVIARALMGDADLILADEPTGNLDSRNAENIMGILRKLNQRGKTIVLITHDPDVAKQCQKSYHLHDGKFVDHVPLPSKTVPLKENASLPRLPFIPYYSLLRSIGPLALQNLRRNKVRAFLTMIGVTVGIAAVFSMLTFGKFAQEKVMKGYEEMGSNTLLIYGHGNWQRKATDRVRTLFDSFDWDKDILALKRVFPEVQKLSPLLQAWGGSTATHAGIAIDEAGIFGVNEHMLPISRRPLSMGKGFNSFHLAQRSPVCVIGSEVNNRLFKETSALGRIIFMNFNWGDKKIGFPCQVVGVFAPFSSSKDWRKPNLDIVLPYTYFQSVFPADIGEIHQFLLQLSPDTDVERSAVGIRNFFIQKYQKAGEFFVSSEAKLVSQMKKSLALFTIMLTAIALITLTVGGIGINNMMLVSVSERFKEIGLRKAVGATDRSIRVQFLLESTLLAGIAGIVGVILGFVSYEAIIYGTSKMVGKLPFEWVFEPVPFLFALISIVLVGIASGIVPAVKAEKLQVIEALRSE
jgi:macrolide transport system ATP-binding/permease protein